MSVQLDVPRRYYVCMGMLRYKTRCRANKYIKASKLEEVLWNQAIKIIQNPDWLLTALRTQMEDPARSDLTDRMAEAKRILRVVGDEERRAFRLFSRGDFTQEIVDDEMAKISMRREQAQKVVNDLSAEEALRGHLEADQEAFRKFTADFSETLDNLTLAERREVMSQLFDEITIDKKNRISITAGVKGKGVMPIGYQAPSWRGRPRTLARGLSPPACLPAAASSPPGFDGRIQAVRPETGHRGGSS